MRLKVKIKIFFAAVGPGLFLIGYNIGTGSITTMAKAGAEFGMSLFWALLLSALFTYVLLVAYGQITLVTGKTALSNFKSEFKYGNILSIYILIALIMGEILALMGIMGIVSELVQEGFSLISVDYNISTVWITAFFAIIIFLLLWNGQYLAFEKILTIFVIIMALCFIAVFIMLKPDLLSIASGLVPQIPQKPGALQIIAAMAGTTCSAAVFIMRSTVVTEKGWTIGDLKKEKKDSLVSASMMLFLSGIIMAVAAGTLHIMGLNLESTTEMIRLFEPIGGKAAVFILILGITGAGLSTIFPILLIAPWLVSDYTGRPRDIKSPMYRILGGIGILFAFGLEFIEQRPPAMVVFSQAFQAFILPAVAIPVFVLINRTNIMKEHNPSKLMNFAIIAVIIFSILTAYFAVEGIL